MLGDELRPGPFLPFIPYHLLYVTSGLRLDVPGASTSPGATVWQFEPNDTNAQHFSLEDAGGGQFFLRTHTGSLYLTAGQGLGVSQEVKLPHGADASQRWIFSSSAITVLDRNKFTILNAAFPGKVLQPAGNGTGSGLPVVLGDPLGTGIHNRNKWEVTSPLLPSDWVALP